MYFLVPSAAAANGSLAQTLGFNVFAQSGGPFTVTLESAAGSQTVEVPTTNAVNFGGLGGYRARVSVPGLLPNTVYHARLNHKAGGAPLDECRARTWPVQLGTTEVPFTLLLGSCYSAVTKTSNDLSQLTKHLSDNRLPHAKLLAGDQVYLDIPWQEVLPRDVNELASLLFRKYRRNWSPSKQWSEVSFGDFLRAGSNLFISDDHEFWNNFPYFLSYGPSLWDEGYQNKFENIARQLLDVFQLVPPALRCYTVGSGKGALSLALLDGRVHRDDRKHVAHLSADLDRLASFLKASRGPAVIAISQPIFEESGNWLERTFGDRGYADLADYGRLVDAIAGCPHDVLILSGDIHRGRISSVHKSPGAKQLAQCVIEVISSPLSLVQGNPYPSGLPDHVYPEKGKSQTTGPYGKIENHEGPVRTNHAAILQFRSAGEGVRFGVEYLGTEKATRVSKKTFERTLR